MTKAMRAGVSALMIVGGVSLGAFAGCSSDDEVPVTPPVETDSGVTDTGKVTPTDTGMAVDTGTATTDTGTPKPDMGTDGPLPPAAPKISIVHAAGGVPTSIKLCIHNSLTGWNALIDTPLPATGLPYGAGGRLDVPASIAPVLPQAGITLYVVPSTFTPPAGKTKCSELIPIGMPAGTPPPAPAGIHKLNSLAAGSFATGKSYVVALTGCPAGEGATSKAKCGPAYDDTANLKATVLTLDNTTAVPATSMGAQFIHLSSHIQTATPAGLIVSFATPAAGGADGGTDGSADTTTSDAADSAATDSAATDSADVGALDAAVPDTAVLDTGPPVPAMTIVDLAGPVSYTDPATVNPATAKMFTELFTSRADTRFNIYASAGGTTKGPRLATLTFGQIEAATTGVPGMQFLVNGKSYTFIAIGDHTKPPPPTGTDPTFFRVIALPNN